MATATTDQSIPGAVPIGPGPTKPVVPEPIGPGPTTPPGAVPIESGPTQQQQTPPPAPAKGFSLSDLPQQQPQQNGQQPQGGFSLSDLQQQKGGQQQQPQPQPQQGQQPQAQPQQQGGDGFSVSDLGSTDPQQLINNTIQENKTATNIQHAYVLGHVNKETALGAIAQLQKNYQSASPDEQKAMDQAEAAAEKENAPKAEPQTSQPAPAEQTLSSLLTAGIPGVVINKLPVQDIQNYVDDQYNQGKLSNAQYADSLEKIKQAKNIMQNDSRMRGGIGLGATAQSTQRMFQAEKDVANLLDQAAPDFLKLRPQQAATEIVKAKDNFLNDVKNFLLTSPLQPQKVPILKQNPAQTSATLDAADQDYQDQIAKFTVTPAQQKQIEAQMQQGGRIPYSPEYMEAKGMGPKPGAEIGGSELLGQGATAALSMIPMPWDEPLAALTGKVLGLSSKVPMALGEKGVNVGQAFLKRGWATGTAGFGYGMYREAEKAAQDPKGFVEGFTNPVNWLNTAKDLGLELGVPTVGGALLGAPFYLGGKTSILLADIMRSANPEIQAAIRSGIAQGTTTPFRAGRNLVTQAAGRTLESYLTGAGRGIPFAAAEQAGQQPDLGKFAQDVNQFGTYNALLRAPPNLVDSLKGSMFDRLFSYRGEPPNLNKAPPLTKYGPAYYDPVQGQNVSLDPYMARAVKTLDPSRQASFYHLQDVARPYADVYMLPDNMVDHIAQTKYGGQTGSGFTTGRDPTTGRMQVFIKASKFDPAAFHETMGHVAYRLLDPADQAGFQHLVSQVTDMDGLANTYANRFNPNLNRTIGMNNLPDEAEINPNSPNYDPQKAQFAASIGNLTKERAYEEAAAEHMGALWSGDRADNWTKSPSLLRKFAYYIGSSAEKMGVRATTPDVDGPLGVAKGVGFAKMMDAYLRDFAQGQIPQTGAKPGYFTGPGGGGGGGGIGVPTAPQPPGGGGGFATAKPAQVLAVRTIGQPPGLPAPQQQQGPPAAPGQQPQPQPIYTPPTGEPSGQKPMEAPGEPQVTTAQPQPQPDPTVVAGLMQRGFTRAQAEDFATRATVNPLHGAPRAELVQPQPEAAQPRPTPARSPEEQQHAQVRQLIQSGRSPGEAQQLVEGGHDPQTTRVLRATWFGRNPDGSVDTTDEKTMSYYDAHHGAWGADLLDKNLTGVAVSKQFLEANGIDPRKSPSSQGYKMRVTAPNGQTEVVDIVDIGPEGKIDMTYGLGKKLGLSDNSHLSVQLLDNQGKTVTLKGGGGTSETAFMPGQGGGGGGGGFIPTPGFTMPTGGQTPKVAQQQAGAEAQPTGGPPPAPVYVPAAAQDTEPENIYPAYTSSYGGGIPAAPGVAFMPSGPGTFGRSQVGGIPLEQAPGVQPSTLGVPNPGQAKVFPLLTQSQQTAATLSPAIQAHAESLSPDDTRVKKQADNLFKGEHFQAGDELHTHVLGNVPDHEKQVLSQAQNAIATRQPMHVTYASAPRQGLGEAAPTTRTRQIEYQMSSPQARMLKQTTAQLAGHSFIPTSVGVKLAAKQGEPHEGYVQGVSTNAVANNHHHLNQALTEAGHTTPYPKINHKFLNDLEGYVSNLNAGYTGTGEGPHAATEEYPATVDPTHVPYRLKRHEADFLNALINNQAAKAKSATGLRELARKGGTLLTPEGETNPIRHAIDKRQAAIRQALAEAHPENPLLQKQAKKLWSQDILEPTIRTFKAGLVHAIHPRHEAMPEAIRPGEEFKGITETLGRTSPLGRPDVPMSTAFMPMAGKKAKGYQRAWAEGRTFETPLPGGGERFEISDRNMKLKPAPEGSPYTTALEHHYHETWGEPMPLHKAIDHPELFENYPQLRRTKISMNPEQRAEGYYEHPYTTDEGKERGDEIHLKEPQDRESLAHELQHAVQYIEGHPPGTSPEQTYIDLHNEPGIKDEMQKAAKEQYPAMSRKEFLNKQEAEGWGNLPPKVQTLQYNDYLDTQRIHRRNWTEKRMRQMAYAVYRRHPGEMEAQVAGARAKEEPPEGFMRPEEHLGFEQGWTDRNYPQPPELAGQQGLAYMPMIGPGGTGFERAQQEGRTFQGPLGPRFELDDSQATYTKSRVGDTVPITDVLDHPELYENYPELANAKFTREKRMPQGVSASYNPHVNWVRAAASATKGDIIHEIQHGIQKLEGVKMGGGTIAAQSKELRGRFQNYTLAPGLRDLFDQHNPALSEEQFHEADPEGDYQQYLTRRAWTKTKAVEAALRQSVPFGRYWREPTEVEAREAGKRAEMTPEERAANPPTFEPGEPEQTYQKGMSEGMKRFFQASTAFMPDAKGAALEKPKNWGSQPEDVRQDYLEKKVARTLANQYRGPETHPLEVDRNEEGGIKYDPAGNPVYKKRDYNIVNSPLLKKKGLDQIKNADEHEDTIDENQHQHLNQVERRRLSAMRKASAVATMGDKIAESYLGIKDIPEIAAGKGWYSRMRQKLADALGEHHELFAQLLGATSAKTPVRNNFIQSLDALEQFKSGDFNDHIEKYLEAYNKLKEGGKAALVAHMKEQGVPLYQIDKKGNRGKDVDNHKSDAAAMANWIHHHDIMPKQKNGQKYNANSLAVLRALAGTWLHEVQAPKTPNFAGNLTGRSLEATIDVWAARHLQRLGYEGQTGKKPWRAQGLAEPGVSGLDFAFSQDAMRHAADKLSAMGHPMNPDDLQAILWFAEKHHYEDKGWTRGAGAKKSSFDDVADLAFPRSGQPMTSKDLREHYEKINLAKKALEYEAHANPKMQAKMGPYMKEHGIQHHHLEAARLEAAEPEEPEEEEEAA
jgi:hypothetical protein